MRAPAPAWAADLNGATIETVRSVLGAALVDAVDHVGEVALHVARDAIVDVLRTLRDTPGLEYQQLMEIAGVDYPDRGLERFEVVYCLLSLTRNHRIRVHLRADDTQPVPSVTGLWPVAGWLEREVYDLYGVLFSGNTDLRRILTDYGFRGHPLRKDFPMTGFHEVRYSEEHKRVVYQPVSLTQDFRNFDFQSPWEGAAYVLPGDEKGALPEAKGAPTPLKADDLQKAGAARTPTQAAGAPSEPYGKTAQSTAETGRGEPRPDDGPERKPADPDVIPSRGVNGTGGQNQ
jgi:NADH-quinone oxidoreductase subunit C